MRSVSTIAILVSILILFPFSSPAYSQGPYLVADINPTGGSGPGYLTVFKSKLYFSALDGINGSELWVYDGLAPPEMVTNVNLTGDFSPKNFTIFNDKLYFSADDGINGVELWAYDDLSHWPMFLPAIIDKR